MCVCVCVCVCVRVCVCACVRVLYCGGRYDSDCMAVLVMVFQAETSVQLYCKYHNVIKKSYVYFAKKYFPPSFLQLVRLLVCLTRYSFGSCLGRDSR